MYKCKENAGAPTGNRENRIGQQLSGVENAIECLGHFIDTLKGRLCMVLSEKPPRTELGTGSTEPTKIDPTSILVSKFPSPLMDRLDKINKNIAVKNELLSDIIERLDL